MQGIEQGPDRGALPARPPTRAQQEVLDAYYRHPNAAAVARTLGRSERNVRRIRDQYRYQLEERWRDRNAELLARAEARMATVEDWIDAELGGALAGIVDLLTSKNEAIRLRVAKLVIGLAAQGPARAAAPAGSPELEELRRRAVVDLDRRLLAIDGSVPEVPRSAT